MDIAEASKCSIEKSEYRKRRGNLFGTDKETMKTYKDASTNLLGVKFIACTATTKFKLSRKGIVVETFENIK